MAASKPKGEFHVVRIPMRPNAHELAILNQRLMVVGLLSRAFLRVLMKRANTLRRDPDWARACALPKKSRERTALFRAVRDRHGMSLSQMDASELCKTVWRSASKERMREFEANHTCGKARRPLGWMPTVFGNRVAGAVGKEVWAAVNGWLVGQRGRPRIKPPHLRASAWNEDAKSGMRLEGDHFIWTAGTGRKDLRIRLGKREISDWWGKRLAGRRVLAVGVAREEGAWWCLVRLGGKPYRDPAYLASVAHGACVGMDAAPTEPAFVGAEVGWVGTLADEAAKERQRQLSLRMRRAQRAQDRSRRATNPDTFDDQGRYIRGRKIGVRSATYRRRQGQLRRMQRRATAQRRTEAEKLVRQVMRVGTRVAVEKTSHRAWQRGRHGRRMLFTRPGEVFARLRAETELLGGEFLELPTNKLALSQHCLCGRRERKDQRQRVHGPCPECGLGPLHRDKLSAFLAHQIIFSGVAAEELDMSEGPFNTPEFRALCVDLCGLRAANPVRHRPVRGGAKGMPAPATSATTLAVGDHPGVGREPAEARQTSRPGTAAAGGAVASPGSGETLAPAAQARNEFGSRETAPGGGEDIGLTDLPPPRAA